MYIAHGFPSMIHYVAISKHGITKKKWGNNEMWKIWKFEIENVAHTHTHIGTYEINNTVLCTHNECRIVCVNVKQGIHIGRK